jgi:hypothetical protein
VPKPRQDDVLIFSGLPTVEKIQKIKSLDQEQEHSVVKDNIGLKIENDFLKKERELHNRVLEKKLEDLELKKLNLANDDEKKTRKDH